MNDRASDHDRRSDPRVTAEHRIHLVVSVHGFDDGDRRFEAKGLTVNLGHRGALVRVDRPVAEGSRCLVHVPGAGKRMGRTLIYGNVLRSRAVADTYEVAIEFETRLHEISAEGD